MLTAYKVGQRLYGPSNKDFYIEIDDVRPDGTIDIKFNMPSGDWYYSINNGSWITIPKSLYFGVADNHSVT